MTLLSFDVPCWHRPGGDRPGTIRLESPPSELGPARLPGPEADSGESSTAGNQKANRIRGGRGGAAGSERGKGSLAQPSLHRSRTSDEACECRRGDSWAYIPR